MTTLRPRGARADARYFAALLFAGALTSCGGKASTVPDDGSTTATGEARPAPGQGSGQGSGLADPGAGSSGSAPSDPGAPTPTPVPVPTPGTPPQPVGPCAVSFATDILPQLVALRCTNAACHGGTNPPNPPSIDVSTPSTTYASLTSFVLSDGQPYVVSGVTRPDLQGIHCNLAGTCGMPMPLGGAASSAQLRLVDIWLTCGAPDN